ncbi:MAG: HAMP domain-containing histidine kinase, partial [Gracilibacteraceae bacterium]|nr:HAMP domain-containing histidine kinase [Gracilibacteraceae bacterium]
LYSRVLIALIAAAVFVAILRLFIQQQGFGDWAVNFLEYALHLDEEDAMNIYRRGIRGNAEIFIFIAVAVCFFGLFRILLSNFMKYFDEANAGIDSLIQGRGQPIELSSEMAFMEQKLNALQQTLEKRELETNFAVQRKNDLVTYLAHDIKTPLTSVIGYLSLLDEAPDMPAEQKAKYVHISLEKACRLENLINEFFEITRYNLQTITLFSENIDIGHMLAQLADEAYPQLAARGKKAAVRAPGDLAVRGDSDKLGRAFNNILKNAICYGEPGGDIDITAELKDDAVQIEFRNAGDIPQDKLVSIFEKFYRLDEARSSDTGGAGLGLAIAREIITMHGGQIAARSENGYTAFTVRLPAGGDVKEM